MIMIATNRMLMNGAVSAGAEDEEFRVAILEGSSLHNLFIDRPSQKLRKANIYKAVITQVVPGLEAVFVDYGEEKHGFLPFKEIAEIYLPPESQGLPVKDRVKSGLQVMVQVEKDERGTKGAALTTFISLAGAYSVLMPNSPDAGGISRRIEGDDRNELKAALDAIELPENMGLIIRTAGVGKSVEELKWDVSILLKYWERIHEAYESRPGPFLIHQESNIIVRAIRDYMRENIDEILVDNSEAFAKVQEYVQQIRPDFLNRVKLYQSTVPLFSRYQIESQIEAALQHEVRLPAGGAIVIDHTEALVSIDVNSSKSTRGGDIEETAFHTNLEAADEIARQLRLRDIGGLIVIDFIDMGSPRHQRDVEERLREALKVDRARVQVGRISRFGLLEMSRQRLRTSLGESTEISCSRCLGHGSIRTIPSLASSLLRLIEEEALKENTGEVRAQVPVDLATFLLNEKRDKILSIEQRHNVHILIIPNTLLLSPHYKIDRIRQTDTNAGSLKSYQMNYTPETPDPLQTESKSKRPISEPAIKSLAISTPHPVQHKSPQKTGIFKRILSIFGSEKSERSEKALETSSVEKSAEITEKVGAPAQRASHPHQGQRHSQRRKQQRRPDRRRDDSKSMAQPRPPKEEREIKEVKEPIQANPVEQGESFSTESPGASKGFSNEYLPPIPPPKPRKRRRRHLRRGGNQGFQKTTKTETSGEENT